MNNYKLFLLDGSNYAELDVEGLDFSSTFSVADIADISQRKDSISKNIKLKSTKNNNRIFGNLYNINRHTDNNINQNLFVNYKPSKKLDCLVYENDTLILKGSLQVIAYKNATYEAIITGSVVNFFGLLGDGKLTDLDFSEYKHTYNEVSIINSWRTSIVKSGSTIPYELGNGFVYPHIVYKLTDTGTTITGTTTSPDVRIINQMILDNFRPAIFVKEYFKKIFNQPTLNGFTYELKGNTAFQEEFKSLIIPDSGDQFVNEYLPVNYALSLNKTTATGGMAGKVWTDRQTIKRIINFNTVNDSMNLVVVNPIKENITSWPESNSAFMLKKTIINTSATGTFNFYILNHSGNFPVDCYLEISEIDSKSTNAETAGAKRFSTIQKTHIATLNGGQSVTKTVSVKVENREWKEGVIYAYNLGIYGDIVLSDSYITFSINSGTATLPATTATPVTFYPTFGDNVIPMPPIEVLQKDFIKSILKMYNLYVYSNIDNPKHIIFEKYDDYYSDTNKLLNSVDWSDKIDYNTDLSLKMNIESDKKYTFNYKDDSDYYNDTLYKKRYNVTYGSFTTGNQTEEKIDLIFSPTPISKLNETERIAPYIYKQESAGTSRTKSNIRILYYNGVKSCTGYVLIDNTGLNFTSPLFIYANCSHIKYVSGNTNYTYVSDLNFGLAREYFSGIDATIYDTPNLFSNYINLIKELNDPNFLTVEADVLLNEIDISNLDFKQPIYISTPSGDGYFKLVEVTYYNSKELSKVKLQKIIT